MYECVLLPHDLSYCPQTSICFVIHVPYTRGLLYEVEKSKAARNVRSFPNHDTYKCMAFSCLEVSCFISYTPIHHRNCTVFTWAKLKVMNQFGDGGKIPFIPNLGTYINGWSASCSGRFNRWERVPGTCKEKDTWSAETFWTLWRREIKTVLWSWCENILWSVEHQAHLPVVIKSADLTTKIQYTSCVEITQFEVSLLFQLSIAYSWQKIERQNLSVTMTRN